MRSFHSRRLLSKQGIRTQEDGSHTQDRRLGVVPFATADVAITTIIIIVWHASIRFVISAQTIHHMAT